MTIDQTAIYNGEAEWTLEDDSELDRIQREQIKLIERRNRSMTRLQNAIHSLLQGTNLSSADIQMFQKVAVSKRFELVEILTAGEYSTLKAIDVVSRVDTKAPKAMFQAKYGNSGDKLPNFVHTESGRFIVQHYKHNDSVEVFFEQSGGTPISIIGPTPRDNVVGVLNMVNGWAEFG